MNGPVRRLLVVTSRFPFENREPYFGTELRELVKHFERVAVAPVRPGAGAVQKMPEGVELLAWPLFGTETVLRALHVMADLPASATAAVRDLFRSRDPGRLKNAAVAIKGLALADWIVEQQFDHVHAYWLSTPASVAYLAAKAGGVSWSATAHRWDIYERNAFDVKAQTAAFVRTISARGATDVWERMPALAERVLHLRLGAVVPEIAVTPRRENGRFGILSPAALVPVKGHADLLAAVAQLRAWNVPVHCTIAGQGPLRETLEQRAASLGLRDHVEFAGYVPTAELHERYRRGVYDAVVLASRSNGEAEMEGVPSALIEAMAEGVPVVATDSGSVGELVDDASGWLVPPSSPAALARALLEVYLNPGTACVRARRAHRIVAERHDVRTQMREFAAAISGERSLT